MSRTKISLTSSGEAEVSHHLVGVWALDEPFEAADGAWHACNDERLRDAFFVTPHVERAVINPQVKMTTIAVGPEVNRCMDRHDRTFPGTPLQLRQVVSGVWLKLATGHKVTEP